MNSRVKSILVYGSILLFAYFIFLIIEGESGGLVPSVVLWSFFGLVFSFVRRYVVRKSNKDKGDCSVHPRFHQQPERDGIIPLPLPQSASPYSPKHRQDFPVQPQH